MSTYHSSTIHLRRRSMCSVLLIALSYHPHLLIPTLVLIVPWLCLGTGLLGLLSVLWLVVYGPVRVNYAHGFTWCSQLSSPSLTTLCLRFYMRSFWVLQYLGLLEDVYGDPNLPRVERAAESGPSPQVWRQAQRAHDQQLANDERRSFPEL